MIRLYQRTSKAAALHYRRHFAVSVSTCIVLCVDNHTCFLCLAKGGEGCIRELETSGIFTATDREQVSLWLNQRGGY